MSDITLGGKPYRVDFLTWRGKDIVDFAPRATVPGGAAVLSDLGLFQPLLQTDWRHGFGFHWYSDALGYMRTEGNVDTRQDGLAMLFTEAQDGGDTAFEHKAGGFVFDNIFYTWGLSGLKKYDPDTNTWTSIYSDAIVNWAIAAGKYIFFAPDNARIKKYDGSGVTDAGLDANAKDYGWLIMHNGYIYAGKHGNNVIHFDNDTFLGTLQGNENDTNRIVVGVGGDAILGAIVYNGNLYVRRHDGIWHIGEDRIARRMLDFSAEYSTDNLRSWAVINGYLVFAVRDRVLQWNGARVSDITPQKITDKFPFTTYGRFNNFVAVGDYLYCTAMTNESSPSEDLLAFDGVGWHRLSRLIDGTADPGSAEITMLAYDGQNNRLWYYSGYFGPTNYFQFSTRSTFPYANFPTSGTHALVTSRIDAGFRRVQKSMDKIDIETQNCDESTYIRVYYALDGGDWVHWDDVKKNGVNTLTYPGGAITREFYYLQLKFEFVTSTATESPILEGYSISFIMRPKTRFGYNFNVLAASEYQHGGHQDDRSAQEILTELKELRDSVSPVEMIDLFGKRHIGYITAVQEQPTYRRGEEDDIDIEAQFNVNFVSVVGEEGDA